MLEDSFGKALFGRTGRNLALTETGRLVLGYADEIFSLGGELEAALRNLPSDRQMVFKVGIADAAPKAIAYRLLAPALAMPDPIRLVCRENSLANLLAELAVHRVDMMIADGSIQPGLNVCGFGHLLGECGISFLALPQLARPLRKGFPDSLSGAPLLMPSETNLVQAKLLGWPDRLRIHPRIVGEFDDSAPTKVFGQAGTGIFVVSTPIATEVAKQYGVQIIASTDEVRDQYYAISVERRISHPVVSAIAETAREWLNPTSLPAAGQNRC